MAAIQVAVFHCLEVMHSSHSTQTLVVPTMVIFNGAAAVTLFFVLSGLVLGLSIKRSAESDFLCTGYLVRRVFRIYPVFFCSILLISFLIPLYRDLPLTDSVAIGDYFPKSVEPGALGENLVFRHVNLSPVTWTLRMEMICSLLLPVCVLAARHSRAFPWAVLLVSVFFAQSWPSVIGISVIPAFLLGYLLPELSWIWRRSDAGPVANLLLVALATGLFLLARAAHLTWATTALLEALGAAAIIGCIVYGRDIPPFRLLDGELIKKAGRISYSYYLIHPIVLVPVVAFLLPALQSATGHGWPVVSAFLIWIVSSAIAFPLAWLSHRTIEMPLIAFSRSISLGAAAESDRSPAFRTPVAANTGPP